MLLSQPGPLGCTAVASKLTLATIHVGDGSLLTYE